MKRIYSLYIKDIIESIDKIEEFTKGMSYNQFYDDEKTRSAVVHKILVIGEATKSIPSNIRARYPQVPWSDMAKMRDKIAHYYFGIDYEIIWNVTKEKMPEIKPTLKKIYNALKEDEDKCKDHP